MYFSSFSELLYGRAWKLCLDCVRINPFGFSREFRRHTLVDEEPEQGIALAP